MAVVAVVVVGAPTEEPVVLEVAVRVVRGLPVLRVRQILVAVAVAVPSHVLQEVQAALEWSSCGMPTCR